MQYPFSIFFTNSVLSINNDSLEKAPDMEKFSTGVVSRVFFGLIFYPLYTLRTRLQMRQATSGRTDQLRPR